MSGKSTLAAHVVKDSTMRISPRKQSQWQWLLSLSVAASVFAACGANAKTPRDTLHDYAEALRQGDANRAYSLMSAEFRGHHSREEFEKMLHDNAQEAEQTAERLATESSGVEVSAQLHFGLNEQMRLVKQGGKWKIASNPLAFYSQKTPQDAVRSFVRAYSLKRWEIMLRFVPTAYREKMTVEMVQKQFEGPREEAMKEMMGVLHQNLESPISEIVKGNQARIRYGEQYEVELVRQQGAWKILHL